MMMPTLQPHIRRGLLRPYAAISIPWVAWFGFKIANAIEDDPYDYDVSGYVFSLLIVPIGGPVLFLIIGWIIAGFRRPNEDELPPSSSVAELPQLSVDDYYAVISGSVSKISE